MKFIQVGIERVVADRERGGAHQVRLSIDRRNLSAGRLFRGVVAVRETALMVRGQSLVEAEKVGIAQSGCPVVELALVVSSEHGDVVAVLAPKRPEFLPRLALRFSALVWKRDFQGKPGAFQEIHPCVEIGVAGQRPPAVRGRPRRMMTDRVPRQRDHLRVENVGKVKAAGPRVRTTLLTACRSRSWSHGDLVGPVGPQDPVPSQRRAPRVPLHDPHSGKSCSPPA